MRREQRFEPGELTGPDGTTRSNLPMLRRDQRALDAMQERYLYHPSVQASIKRARDKIGKTIAALEATTPPEWLRRRDAGETNEEKDLDRSATAKLRK